MTNYLQDYGFFSVFSIASACASSAFWATASTFASSFSTACTVEAKVDPISARIFASFPPTCAASCCATGGEDPVDPSAAASTPPSGSTSSPVVDSVGFSGVRTALNSPVKVSGSVSLFSASVIASESLIVSSLASGAGAACNVAASLMASVVMGSSGELDAVMEGDSDGVIESDVSLDNMAAAASDDGVESDSVGVGVESGSGAAGSDGERTVSVVADSVSNLEIWSVLSFAGSDEPVGALVDVSGSLDEVSDAVGSVSIDVASKAASAAVLLAASVSPMKISLVLSFLGSDDEADEVSDAVVDVSGSAEGVFGDAIGSVSIVVTSGAVLTAALVADSVSPLEISSVVSFACSDGDSDVNAAGAPESSSASLDGECRIFVGSVSLEDALGAALTVALMADSVSPLSLSSVPSFAGKDDEADVEAADAFDVVSASLDEDSSGIVGSASIDETSGEASTAALVADSVPPCEVSLVL